jgi:16S rRNA (cytosine967-C5)-methyltransferase
MKLHFHLIAAIVSALQDIFVDGRYADKVIEHQFKQHPKWGARDRRLFAESVYDIVRWWRWTWHLAGLPDPACLIPAEITPQRVWHVWAAYWVNKGEYLPPFPEVATFNPSNVAPLSNAKVTPALKASVPDWLYDLGQTELGDKWPAVITALNEPADVFLRANELKTTTADLKKRLAAEDIHANQVTGVPSALKLTERKSLFTSKSYREGFFEVQDAASQRIAPFLQVEPGMRVIDACAGAGGKSLHLAALMKNKGKIIALDVHDWKLKELRKRAGRAGADVIEARLIEDTKAIKRLAGEADRVLLDVPCSGLGVLRRNPDAKWKLSLEEIDRLQQVQAEILTSHSRMVKPGGKLVYATCSILPGENNRQVATFLAANPDAWTLEEELTLLPDNNTGDGFYAARLARNA